MSSTEQRIILPGTKEYFVGCAYGGILSCGITHTGITPLDLVKCRLQTDPSLYRGIFNGFSTIFKKEGVSGLYTGWMPTLFGYSAQGLFKFGLYEVFKHYYSEMVGEESAFKYRTSLYLAASASAEFVADIALCPMEAVKVRMQTMPGFPTRMLPAMRRMFQAEGMLAFYKGLAPLWMRQIPYTMMKFSCFERTVETIYGLLPLPKEEYGTTTQLGVTFLSGYIAGVFCAVVSHPADTIVSKMNKNAGTTAMECLTELGLKGVWRGLGPRIIMIGTLTATQWFIYDSWKTFCGLQTAGGKGKTVIKEIEE
eukprot:GCRY01000522.1.p1 GENE.GCRY01000522.1~~GCRY01000522.1.p1  ORF type:complete len:310 (-),score=28.45 GCRY01000522.1:157-1086(-)